MTTKQKATMYAQIEQHGMNLNAIFNTGIEPVTLCKKLRRLEMQGNKIATDWCNGDVTDEQVETLVPSLLGKVTKILGNAVPVKFNGDARGYALKISDEVMRAQGLNLYQDWGGNGIICPDFTPNN